MIRALINRVCGRHADGGSIASPRLDNDSVLIRVSPGYVSGDRGETWHEVPAETGTL